MIGNGENIRCTHNRLLDVLCIQNNGSAARDAWDIKLVPQLNHDLFRFTSTMKEGWQINGRWKKHGIKIVVFKKGHESFFFDRMIPSGSPWLLGVIVKGALGQVHAVIVPGKRFSMNKLHQITGHTGRHLIVPTSHYLGIEVTGKLNPYGA